MLTHDVSLQNSGTAALLKAVESTSLAMDDGRRFHCTYVLRIRVTKTALPLPYVDDYGAGNVEGAR